MLKPFIFLIFLSFLKSELLMVAEFFRHGAREPVYEYYDYKSYASKGELTSVGMRQHYHLGLFLRHEYIDKLKFLSPNYNPSEIYVSSTNLNRTIISALSQLYGLYPLGTGPNLTPLNDSELYDPPFETSDPDFKFPDNVNYEALPNLFQPIPIHNTGLEDKVLRPYDRNVCQLNEEWQRTQQETDFFKALVQELRPTIENVKLMMNISEEIGLKQIEGIYDVFQNDKWAGKQLPDAFQGELKRNMSFVYNFWYYYVNFGTERQRLTLSGVLFREIREYFRAKLEGRETKKWLMYSAHDTTLIMILSALNLSNYQCNLAAWKEISNNFPSDSCIPLPDYASTIIFELHRNDISANVKIRYNGKFVKEYDYNIFEQILNKSVTASENDIEFQNECGSLKLDFKELEQKNEGNSNIQFFIGLLVGIILSGIFCVLRAQCLKKRGILYEDKTNEPFGEINATNEV